jgi:chromosome condensin MukBEF ATPase and DNA-binding subunit MukB
MTTPEERIAVLEVQVENLQKTLDLVGNDVRTIRDTLAQARGGWKTLLLVAGFAGTVGAFIGKFTPFFIIR